MQSRGDSSLYANSVTEDTRSQLCEQAGSVALRQIQEDGVDTLALCIPHGSESVAGYSTSNQARHIGNNEAQSATTGTTHQAPELARRPVAAILGHSLIPHHLLKHVLELRLLCLLPIFRCLSTSLFSEKVPGP